MPSPAAAAAAADAAAVAFVAGAATLMVIFASTPFRQALSKQHDEN